MNSNLESIDKRIAEQERIQSEAANNADLKSFERAEKELSALREIRKFYEGGGE